MIEDELDEVTVVAEDPNTSWLMVVDMQAIFGDLSSPWCAAGFAGIVPQVVLLVEHFGPQVVFTRYLAPVAPTGSWIPYFQQWPFALRAHDDPLFELVEPFPELARRIADRQTFGKWDAAMHRAIEGAGEITIVGVATECCVLATALAAADDGMAVRIVTDACAGGTRESHEAALGIMSLYAPQITLTTSAEILGGD